MRYFSSFLRRQAIQVLVIIILMASLGLLTWYLKSSVYAAYGAGASPQAARSYFSSKLFGRFVLGEVPATPSETEELLQILGGADEAANRVLSAGPGGGQQLREITAATEDELEAFLARNPGSGWGLSLRKELAARYQESGRITRALKHWQDGWNTTFEAREGYAKVVADYSLVYGARLLASLGRLEELEPLVLEHQHRILAEPHLAQMWVRTVEAVSHMKRKPGIAYICGPYALDNVSEQLYGRRFGGIMSIPSGTNGFTLAELSALSDTHNLGLVAAVRAPGADFIIPAVAHWKQNHYSAITFEEDGRFLVKDPTFPKQKWVDSDVLEDEFSGFFLIPDSQPLPEGWRLATAAEMLAVYGKGYFEWIEDDDDDCTPNGGGMLGSDGCCPPEEGPDGTGDGDSPCGMPTFEVREPNINLEVSDIPMRYETAIGPDFVLRLSWRQRKETYQLLSNFGQAWESQLLAHVTDTYGPRYGLVTSTIDHFSGDGFVHKMTFTGSSLVSDQNPSSGTWAVRSTTGGLVTKIEVYYRNGAKDTYQNTGSETILRLTARADATGQAMTFAYDRPDGTIDRLTQVTTADGVVFTFGYTSPANDYSITGVTSPGRSVSFGYSSGVLTSITDAVGIVSSFTYDPATQWITDILTPYGTNTFTHKYSNDYCGSATPLHCQGIDRSLVIKEPAGTHQVYVFYDNPYSSGLYAVTNAMANKVPSAFAASQIPVYALNDPPIQTLDTVRDERNSHYWNRQQAALIPASTLANLNLLTNVHYIVSRTRHWLRDNGDVTKIKTLSWELPPSHDGVNEVRPVFYDYLGKNPGWDGAYGGSYTTFIGTNQSPAVISQRMPDNSTRYDYFERNALGMNTNHIERWVQNGSVTKRTNQFKYATGTGKAHVDNLLKVEHKGPNGELIFGRALHGTYDDQIGRETNAVGEVTIFNYDSYRRLTTKQTHAGLLSTHTYNGSNYRLEKVVDTISGTPLRTNHFAWLDGYLRTNTDPRGLTRTFTFDDLGRVTQVLYPDSTTETFDYTLPAWTGFNQTGSGVALLELVTYKDRMGNYSRTLPNRNRQIEKVIEPSRTTPGSYGTEHTIDYCGCGSPTSIIRGSNLGAAAETTTLGYNYQGRMTSVILPNTRSMTWTYDVLGRLSTEVDTLQTRTLVYDNLSRLVEDRNGVGLVSGGVYDRSDRLTALTNSTGVIITNLYDGLGRILVRGYPTGGKELWSYTPGWGAATRYTNQIGNVTTWAYDAAQRRTNEIGVSIYTNSFAYTPANDLRDLVDGKSQKTTWVFDAEGRMTRKTNQASALILTNGYNANGQVTARWTAQKGLTAYTYDGARNLTFVNYPSTIDITYQYNAFHRLTNMIDAAGTTKFTYSTAGDLLTEDAPWANDTVTYGYHANVPHLRTSLSLQQPTGSWSETFGYDAARRLQTVTSPAGTFTYTYSTGVGSVTNASMLWKKLALFSGASAYITNVFDTSGRLTGTTLKNSSNTTLNNHGYGYNNANQRNSQTFPDASTAAYGYDTIGQLKSSDSSINTEDRGYVYDAAWNLNTRTNNGVTTAFAVNVENELTSVGGVGCTYDANGNITSDGTRSFSYNEENQMVSVSSGSSYRYDYVYDGFGRMRKRLTYLWSSGAWSLYYEDRLLYDGRLVIQERNNSDLPLVAYTRGWDLSGSFEGAGGIGGMLARSHAYSAGSWSTHHGYHSDGGGNITAMVSTAQALSANYKYDPYGNLISSSGTMSGANSYRFSSKDFNPTTGLSYYGFRFYHPALQRWLNHDPIGEAGGMNLYGMIGNSPVNRLDPYGLCFTPETAMDVASMAMGAASFGENLGLGNYWSAALDLLGYGIDSVAAVTPLIPGGIGATLKTVRAADKAADASKINRKTGGGPGGTGDTGGTPDGGVYALRDPETGQVQRTGRSNDLERRRAEHARDPKTEDLVFDPLYRTDDYAEQRGLEDLAHFLHNPPMNRIRPISPRNRNLQTYRDAAQGYINRCAK